MSLAPAPSRTLARRAARATVGGVLALTLAGCAANAPSASPTTPTAATGDDIVRCASFDADCVEVLAPDTVELRGILFRPPLLEVTVGTTVTFSNLDPLDHTITAGSKDDVQAELFDLVVDDAGDTASHTFDEVGSYPYFCRIHPSTMIGTIEVTAG